MLDFDWEYEDESVILPVGLTLFLIGLLIRIWAQEHVHFRLKTQRALARTGPYQFVRHPIYIANTIMCAAVTLLCELVWFIPVTVAWCIGVYSLLIRFEEERLVDQYDGQYLDYAENVPMWFPKVASVALHNGLGLVNEYFFKSVLVELHCLLLLLPAIVKELVEPWFH